MEMWRLPPGKHIRQVLGLGTVLLFLLSSGAVALVDSRTDTATSPGMPSPVPANGRAAFTAQITSTTQTDIARRAARATLTARLTATARAVHTTPMPPVLPTVPLPVETPLALADALPGQQRVGIQVGHWYTAGHPDEAAHLRASYGARYGEISEVQLNYAIATRVRRRLEAAGVAVDLLAASIPPSYQSDAFIALHADGATPADEHPQHGWKIAAPFLASPASEHLLAAVSRAYAQAIRLPYDGEHITDAMRFYHAFNYYRYTHAIAPTTPGIIIEMGYLSHPTDRAVLLGQPERVARAIANGVLHYLEERDGADTAARQPRRVAFVQPVIPTLLLAAPYEDAVPIRSLTSADLLLPVSQLAGWYRVLVQDTWELGWVRTDQVVQAP